MESVESHKPTHMVSGWEEVRVTRPVITDSYLHGFSVQLNAWGSRELCTGPWATFSKAFRRGLPSFHFWREHADTHSRSKSLQLYNPTCPSAKQHTANTDFSSWENNHPTMVPITRLGRRQSSLTSAVAAACFLVSFLISSSPTESEANEGEFRKNVANIATCDDANIASGSYW